MTAIRKSLAASLAIAAIIGLAGLLVGRILPTPEGGPSWLSADGAGALIAPAWGQIGDPPPVADAGLDRRVVLGDTVVLDASRSIHPEGDELALSWTFFSAPAMSGASLSDPTAVKPSFTVDLPGTYVVQLTVSDGFGASATDTVTLSTEPPAARGHCEKGCPFPFGRPVRQNCRRWLHSGPYGDRG